MPGDGLILTLPPLIDPIRCQILGFHHLHLSSFFPLNSHTTITLVQIFLFSRLYCFKSILLGFPPSHPSSGTAAKENSLKRCLLVSLFKELQWLPVSFLISYKLFCVALRALHSLTYPTLLPASLCIIAFQSCYPPS